MPILELQNLTKCFGGLTAVSKLNLAIERGEIVGLIGPNGAGKTTVFNLISGFLKPTSGSVWYNGEDITGLKPCKIASKGIIRTFQFATLFRECSVLDNVILGSYLQYRAGFWGSILGTSSYHREEAFFKEKAMELLELSGLEQQKNEPAKDLSYGQQRALGLAIALAAEPQILLLDEPVAGMTAEEIGVMMERVGRINQQKGTTIVLVEHNMQALMSISRWVAVVNFGQKIAEGLPKAIVNDPLVKEAYLGK